MEETPRDKVFRDELTDPERLKYHFGRLIELLDSELSADRMYLVYILSQSSRVGHLISEPWSLNAMFGDKYDNIVIVTGPAEQAANPAIFDYLKSKFRVIETDDIILTTMGFINVGGAGVKNYDFYLRAPHELFQELSKYFASGGPHRFLQVPDQDISRTKAFLERSISDPSLPYVTLHVRDAGFEPEMAYHSFRFVPVESYRPAVEFLLESGYAVVRMGDVKSPPLGLDHPNYVEIMRQDEYERAYDFGLVGGAAFGICVQSGPYSLFQATGRPILITNAYPLDFWGFFPHELSIYKHFFRKDGSRLTYREIGQARIFDISTAEALAAAGLTVETNSAEEILAATREMVQFIEKGILPDDSIQRRFMEITAEFDDIVCDVPAIGTANPRWHQHLCASYLDLNPEFLS